MWFFCNCRLIPPPRSRRHPLRVLLFFLPFLLVLLLLLPPPAYPPAAAALILLPLSQSYLTPFPHLSLPHVFNTKGRGVTSPRDVPGEVASGVRKVHTLTHVPFCPYVMDRAPARSSAPTGELLNKTRQLMKTDRRTDRHLLSTFLCATCHSH